MKKIETLPRKAICTNDNSPFMYFGWPSVTRLPDGTLAMAASGLRFEHVCPFGKGVIAYSRDEGETWTRPMIVMDTPLDDRDCGLVPFGKGRVMLTSFNNCVAFQRGINQKRRISSDPVVRAKADLIDAYLNYVEIQGLEEKYLGSNCRISEDGGYTFGSIFKAPVSAPHGPCCLNDGTLLYVGHRFNPNAGFDDGEIPYVQCYKMTADERWEYVSSIENVRDGKGKIICCEPHAIQLPDGTIIVHIRVQRSEAENRIFTVYQSESTDGGKTFTQPHQILADVGGTLSHLMLHSSGTLVAAYTYRDAPYGIRVMFSRDGAKTWDTDWILSDEGQSGDLGYPATVERSDGSLLTIYYENVDGCSRIMQNIWKLPNLK